MVPEPPEGKASPCRPMAPRDSYETHWCVLIAGRYPPWGNAKRLSATLLRSLAGTNPAVWPATKPPAGWPRNALG